MKVCKSCGYENIEENIYCEMCGNKLDTDIHIVQDTVNKPSKKRISRISIGILLVVSLVAGLIFVFQTPKENKEYQEAIAVANKYLEMEEYTKAEDKYLYAISIDPKQKEAYQQLAIIYTKAENEEQLDRLMDSAKDNLSENDFKFFQEELNPKKEIVSSVKSIAFEQTPIDLGDVGYLVKIDGKYGVIDENQKWVVEPVYDKYVENTPLRMDGKESYNISFFNGDDSINLANIIEDTNIYETYESVTWGSGANNGVILVKEGSKLIPNYYVYKMDRDEYKYNSFFDYVHDGCYFSLLEGTFEPDEYYIVSSKGEAFGPYDIDEVASYDYRYTKEVFDETHQFGPPGLFYGSHAPFYVQTKDNKYEIYDMMGVKKNKDVFDLAIPISSSAIKVTKNGKMGIVNENAELVYLGDYQDVSNVINGKAFVKVDGEWVQIEV